MENDQRRTIEDVLEINNAAVDELVYQRLCICSLPHPKTTQIVVLPSPSPSTGNSDENNTAATTTTTSTTTDGLLLLKPLRMFTNCLQSVQTYLRRLEQEQQEQRRAWISSSTYSNSNRCSANEKVLLSKVSGYHDDDDDEDDLQDHLRRVVGPSIDLSVSSLGSLFNYSLCGIDSRYFVYTNSIKLRFNERDDDDPMGVDNDNDHHQHEHQPDNEHDEIDAVSYTQMVTGVLLFNIAQVYHIVGLQQEERRRRSSRTSSSAVEEDGDGDGEDDTDNEGSNLSKAEQMYCLAIHSMYRRVQEYISFSSSLPLTLSSGTANHAISASILVTLGALNNLATLQLRRQDQARTTLKHLLGLLLSLSMPLSSSSPSSSSSSSSNNSDTDSSVLSGLLQDYERNGMLCNCLLVLLRGNHPSPSSSSTSSNSNGDDCNAAPA
eukprot:CAMPEP_0113494560 /NCGR_PEP_ID=MMETSP0014_2-20120614/29167_1 /TAXON_ID=2857 /ORGANISM="Nitzschia sp." /LENGTH=435 /DNA_ID=CAMNT_0000388451 /DNA_START=174 /DNA_END=1478 /DNA_ORIENTATION=+ /assembly_acc=CAM_ASM_000159